MLYLGCRLVIKWRIGLQQESRPLVNKSYGLPLWIKILPLFRGAWVRGEWDGEGRGMGACESNGGVKIFLSTDYYLQCSV